MDRRFDTTRWSVVLAARTTSAPNAREALAELCETYWYPLYAFVRRQGYGPDEARDLTQGYFVRLLDKRMLRDVDPAAGRFRSFLLASLKHFLSNERDRMRALKRGGGAAPISLDGKGAEQRYAIEPTDNVTAETIYERRWAFTVLERVQDRLRDEMRNAGREAQYDALHEFITAGSEGRSYRQVADPLEMSEGAVKMAVHRMRHRFGELLRQEITDTVSSADQVEPEIRHLLSVVRG